MQVGFLPCYVSAEIIHGYKKHPLFETNYFLSVFLYYVEPLIPNHFCLKALGKNSPLASQQRGCLLLVRVRLRQSTRSPLVAQVPAIPSLFVFILFLLLQGLVQVS